MLNLFKKESQFRRMLFFETTFTYISFWSLSKYGYFFINKDFFLNGKVHKIVNENIFGQALRYYVMLCFFVSSLEYETLILLSKNKILVWSKVVMFFKWASLKCCNRINFPRHGVSFLRPRLLSEINFPSVVIFPLPLSSFRIQ